MSERYFYDPNIRGVFTVPPHDPNTRPGSYEITELLLSNPYVKFVVDELGRVIITHRPNAASTQTKQ